MKRLDVSPTQTIFFLLKTLFIMLLLLYLLKPDSSCVVIVQPFVVAMVDEHSEFVFLGIVQDAVDGVVTGDVLYLAAVEVVLCCKRLGIHLAQVGNHRAPDLYAGFDGRFLELNLVEEATLEGFV